jgi:uncharacterized protein YerC
MDALDNRIAEMLQKGATKYRICVELGVGKARVERVRAGRERPGESPADMATDRMIAEMLRERCTHERISAALGVGRCRIRRIMECRRRQKRMSPVGVYDSHVEEGRRTTQAERHAAVYTGSGAEWVAIMEEWLARHGEHMVTCSAVHQIAMDLGMSWYGENTARCLASAEGRVHAGHRIMGAMARLPGWRLVPVRRHA